MAQTGTVRLVMGMHPDSFQWLLEPGSNGAAATTTFQTPECVLVHSPNGVGQLSRSLHRLIRNHLTPPPPRPVAIPESQSSGSHPQHTPHHHHHHTTPVLVNSWEAMYFNCTEQKIMEQLVYPGREMGLDMVVLDDGWFVKRYDDKRALGDWRVDRTKFPSGLDGLADRVQSAGMALGIWMEPEMISVVG